MASATRIQREQIIVGFLLLLFGGILLRCLKQMGLLGKSNPSVVAGPVVTLPAPKPLVDVASSYRDRSEMRAEKMEQAANVSAPKAVQSYAAQGLRDPLVSLLPKPKVVEPPKKPAAEAVEEPPLEPPQLVVNGLWWGGTRPQAVINGHLYAIGDEVEGAKITSIAADGVTVEFDGREIRLGMLNPLETPMQAPVSY